MNRQSAFLIVVCLSVACWCNGTNFYVCVKQGNDQYPGSETKPFRTIAKALSLVKEGDICYLKEGIYREAVTLSKNKITLKAYKNDYVQLSGCKLIDSELKPSKINNSGYTTYYTSIQEKVYQAFVDGKLVNIARHPNKTVSMTSNMDWANTYVDEQEIVEWKEDIPENLTDYSDGYYIGNHTPVSKPFFTGWYAVSIPVVKGSKAGLTVDGSKSSAGFLGQKHGTGNGLGYIIGAKAALDTLNEWYANGNTFFINLPDGVKPENAKVEVRTQLYIMQLEGNNVTLENLHFKAGSLYVKGSGNSILNCTFRYISPFIHNPVQPGEDSKGQTLAGQWGTPLTCSAGVYIEGNHTTVKNSYFAHSWFSGITLSGNNCTMENSVVEDVNWIGRRSAGIHSFGTDNSIRYCSVRNTGAAAIEGGNRAWVGKFAIRNIWEHNHCTDACLLVVDQAIFYINTQHGEAPLSHSIWRYNVIENCHGPEKGKWASTIFGFYLDNNTSGMLVHNNIIINTRSAIRYNDFRDDETAGRDVVIFNNTCYNCKANFSLGFMNSTTKLDDSTKRIPPVLDAVTVVNNVGIGSAKSFYNKLDLNSKEAKKRIRNNIERCSRSILEYDLKGQPKNFLLIGKVAQGIPVIVYDPEMAPEAAQIDYAGAVDPQKEIFKAGANLSVPDFAKEKQLLFN